MLGSSSLQVASLNLDKRTQKIVGSTKIYEKRHSLVLKKNRVTENMAAIVAANENKDWREDCVKPEKDTRVQTTV